MGKASVLIVEDEKITALDLKEKLEEMGYDVPGMVSSGEDAIRTAAEVRPDLILMDIMLKGEMDGIQAAAKINSLEIPIVYLTAYADKKTLERAKKSASYGYMVKPYREKDLEVMVEAALEKHQTDQEEMEEVRQEVIRRTWKPPLQDDSKDPARIMVVEDEFVTALDLEEKLEEMGYNVVSRVASGEIAVETARKLQPDIILMDIMLKGEMDGVGVSQEIKELKIPIVYLTAYADDKTLKRALETAPYGYLLKPYQDKELHSTLEMALKKKKIEEEKKKAMGDKISEKQEELKVEKTGVFFVSAVIISLAVYGLFTKDMTWLMYLLFVPACYNLYLTILSFRKTPPIKEFDKNPMVSILIPAHNEEFTIERCVRSLSELDYYLDGQRNYEIVVINDGSTDRTGVLLEKLKEDVDCLRIVTRKPPRAGKGKGYVLNDGVHVAEGEVIAVFDADARVQPDFLKLIIPYLNEEKVAGVQARVRMYNKDKNVLTAMQEVEFAIFGNVVLKSRDVMGENAYLGGNGQLTYKSVVEEIGGWDGFAVTEDLNMSIKLMIENYQIRFCPEAEVWQEAVPQWRPFFRQRVRWATGNLETLFVYLNPIIDAKIPFYKKMDSIQYLFFLMLTAFVMLGYIVFLLNTGRITHFAFEAPLAIGIISTIAFFPGVFLGVYRDKVGIIKSIIKSIEYWAYCLYLVPLFFAAFLHMITRKDRQWAKTHHSG
ncbi:MAG TPA: response regulator [Methanobacteriaceae archaeon]|nr:response regulator [Methanobacteriaceae archaeon]